MYTYLDFEKPIADLENRIGELKKADSEANTQENAREIEFLEKRVMSQLSSIYGKLTPWQRTQVARHPNRPRFLSFANRLFTDITPLAGDRCFGNDEAVQAGFASAEREYGLCASGSVWGTWNDSG